MISYQFAVVMVIILFLGHKAPLNGIPPPKDSFFMVKQRPQELRRGFASAYAYASLTIVLRMLTLLLILVSTAASTTVGVTNVKVSDGAPEMLRSMIGAPHLSRRSTRNRAVPEAMLSLYAAQTEDKTDTKILLRGASTIRSFTHKDRDDITGPSHSDAHRLLWFNISDISESERLRAAHLELNRIPHGAHKVYIHVHDVIRRSPPVTRLIDTRIVFSKGSDKIILDVEPAVRRWLADPSTNHGVVVELAAKNTTAAANHVRIRRSSDDPSWLNRQPVLLTYMDDSQPRKKRNPKRKHSRRHCRRHSMYVDFAAVGWDDWIVAPSGYEAYYCQGDCTYPIADHLNATNHAIVQTLQNSADPRAVPKPCCVPTTLAPISMLYTDSDDKTVLKVYHDMVVLGCGCR